MKVSERDLCAAYQFGALDGHPVLSSSLSLRIASGFFFSDATSKSTRACRQFCGTPSPRRYRSARVTAAVVSPACTAAQSRSGVADLLWTFLLVDREKASAGLAGKAVSLPIPRTDATDPKLFDEWPVPIVPIKYLPLRFAGREWSGASNVFGVPGCGPEFDAEVPGMTLDWDGVGELECADVDECPAAQNRNATNATLDARRRPRTVPRTNCRRQAAKCLCKEMRSVESSGGTGEVSGFVSRTRMLANGADAWCVRLGGAS